MDWINLKIKAPVQYEWVLVETTNCRYPFVVAEFRAGKFIDTNGVIILNVEKWKRVN